ncbi:MAG TPA: ABC transporter permease [Actinomycetota bacterium]|nr:ABC transporter permease [Actinomycetota bacterium]
MSAVLADLRERTDPDALERYVRWAAFASMAIMAWVFTDKVALGRGLPLGIIVLGLVFGSLYALIAVGLVLVYRANRVVNFAQAELGVVAAVLAIELVIEYDLNYFVAIATGFAAAALSGMIVDLVVVRVFRNAPRLILAVATIGVAQILTGLAIQIPLWWSGPTAVLRRSFTTPFNVQFSIYPVRFSGDHLMAMIAVPVIIVALTAFLRLTDYGVAIRASAENGDRAQLLGMPIGRLSTIVWGIAGFLSAVAVILRVSILGFTTFSNVSGGGASLLLRTFAAAVIARMENMAVAAIAALGIGVFESSAIWIFSNSTYSDALLVGVILIALIMQRGHFSRFTETGISTWRALREVRPIPTELRRLPEVRWGLVGMWAVLGAAVLSFPVWASPGREQLASLIFIYSIVAVSLVVLTGWVGQISLGQWALVGFGGAAASVLVGRHGLDLFIAIPTAMVVGAVVALIIGIPALRISGPFLAVTTLAFAVTSRTFFLEDRYLPWFVQERIERPVLWERFPIALDWQFYYFSLVFLVLVILAARNLRRSRTGRALVAVRDNEPAAQSTSLNVPILKLTAFAISGAIAGLAGSLYVLHQTGLNTDSFGPEVSLRLFTMVVIGGLGSLPGAILGAVYVRSVEFFIGGGWALLASGGGILLILLVLPGGLGAGVYRARDEILRWIAQRRGIVVPSLLADIRQEEVEEEEAVPLDDVLAGVRSGRRSGRPMPQFAPGGGGS